MREKRLSKIGIKKKVCLWSLSLAMLFAFCISPFSFADQLTDKQGDLSDINSDIAALEKELSNGQTKKNNLTKEIKNVETKIYSAQQKLNKLTSNLNDTKEKIAVALAELEELQGEINVQNTNLNDRLRAMYKNGDIGMLSVLLGSKSMSDFLTNIEMAKKIYVADQALLEDMNTAYQVVVEKKEELASLKDQLLSQQDEVTTYKAGLAASEDALAAQKKKVEQDNKALEAQIDALQEEADRLKAEILKLQGKEAYAGGIMCWPSKASTRITSPFGNRMHPILKKYKLHTGIDIGASKGTDILAANDGKVIKAAYNAGGYGYYVMIDHGGGIVTLYAHSSKLLVSVGDVVKRGDVIAKVGSTGQSTGPHLHFEVRINGEYVDPMGYVTPGKY